MHLLIKDQIVVFAPLCQMIHLNTPHSFIIIWNQANWCSVICKKLNERVNSVDGGVNVFGQRYVRRA